MPPETLLLNCRLDGEAYEQGAVNVAAADDHARREALDECREIASGAERDETDADGHQTSPIVLDEVHDLVEEEAAWVRGRQRIVEHIGIAVVALRVLGKLDVRIGADEPPDVRIVHPAVHVDQVQVVQVLVPGEAARRLEQIPQRIVTPATAAAFAEGIV